MSAGPQAYLSQPPEHREMADPTPRTHLEGVAIHNRQTDSGRPIDPRPEELDHHEPLEPLRHRRYGDGQQDAHGSGELHRSMPQSVLPRPYLGHRDESLRRVVARITPDNPAARI